MYGEVFGPPTPEQVAGLLSENIIFNGPDLIRPIEDRDAIARAIAHSPRRAEARTTKLKGDINMRAVQLTAFGNPVDGLEYVDIPEPDAPGPNQVLIGVEFSPINSND